MKKGWLQQYKQGGMIKRADGSYSQRGLWDNIRANAGSGKKPTKEMLDQEKKIKANEKAQNGKNIPYDEYKEGGNVSKKIDYSTSDYIDGVYNPSAKTNRQLASITRKQMDQLVLQQQIRDTQKKQEESVIQAAQPKRSIVSKIGAIARNPLTAFGYAVGNQELPDYFDKGERNLFDNAIDIVNPLNYYDAAKNIVTGKHFRDANTLGQLAMAVPLTALDATQFLPGGEAESKVIKSTLKKGKSKLKQITRDLKFEENNAKISPIDMEAMINDKLRQGLGIKKTSDNVSVKYAKGNPFSLEGNPQHTFEVKINGRQKGAIGLSKLNPEQHNIPNVDHPVFVKIADYPYMHDFTNNGNTFKNSGISGEINKAITDVLQENKKGFLYSSAAHTDEGYKRWEKLVKKGKAEKLVDKPLVKVVDNEDLYSSQSVYRLKKYGGDVYKKGGEIQPIVVSSKNDPRYIAYQDSLNLHNMALEYSKDYRNSEFFPLVKKPISSDTKEFMKEALNDTSDENKAFKKIVKLALKSNINPTGYFSAEGQYLPFFEKPKQPYIVDNNIQQIPNSQYIQQQPQVGQINPMDVPQTGYDEYINANPFLNSTPTSKDFYEVPKFKQGGSVKYTPEQEKMLSKIHQEFMYGNPSAIRMMNLNTPSYQFKGNELNNKKRNLENAGTPGTHYMGSIDNFAVPYIQQNDKGQMYFNPNASPRDREAMRFNTEEEANYFGEHYKEVAPMMQQFKQGGTINTYTPVSDNTRTKDTEAWRKSEKSNAAKVDLKKKYPKLEAIRQAMDLTQYLPEGYEDYMRFMASTGNASVDPQKVIDLVNPVESAINLKEGNDYYGDWRNGDGIVQRALDIASLLPGAYKGAKGLKKGLKKGAKTLKDEVLGVSKAVNNPGPDVLKMQNVGYDYYPNGTRYQKRTVITDPNVTIYGQPEPLVYFNPQKPPSKDAIRYIEEPLEPAVLPEPRAKGKAAIPVEELKPKRTERLQDIRDRQKNEFKEYQKWFKKNRPGETLTYGGKLNKNWLQKY